MKTVLSTIITISAIFLLALLSGCPGTGTVDVRVRVSEWRNKVWVAQTSGYQAIQVSKVPGFEHKYDSMSLTITNNDTGAQLFIENMNNPDTTISITKGNYDFYLSNRSVEFKVFMSFMDIGADARDVEVNGPTTVDLNPDSRQCVFLIDKSVNLTSTPIITWNYGDSSIPMFNDENFWYVYAQAGFGYTVDYEVNGVPGQRINDSTIEESFYMVRGAVINIPVPDPFDTVIYL